MITINGEMRCPQHVQKFVIWGNYIVGYYPTIVFAIIMRGLVIYLEVIQTPATVIMDFLYFLWRFTTSMLTAQLGAGKGGIFEHPAPFNIDSGPCQDGIHTWAFPEIETLCNFACDRPGPFRADLQEAHGIFGAESRPSRPHFPRHDSPATFMEPW